MINNIIKQLLLTGQSFSITENRGEFTIYSEKIDIVLPTGAYKFGNIVVNKRLKYHFNDKLIFAVLRSRPNSSNVRFLRYYDKTKILQVGFNDRSVYEYYDIDFDTWKDIDDGNAICSTEGSNDFGDWFIGKTPSSGAAIHKYLINKGVRYKRI
jgi:hypothetical protein